MKLEKKLALVTGGARGIGKTICKNFLDEGASVAIFDVNEDAGKETAESFNSQYGEGKASFYKVDITDEKEVENTIENIISRNDKIDILVNNAGITMDNLILRMSVDDWKKVIDINLTGSFICAKYVIKHMVKARSGNIINISSIVGVHGNAGQANYSASKAGDDMLVNSYRVTFGIPVIIVRSSNNFGQYQYPEKIIPLFVTNAIYDKPLPLYGDGMNVRDWLYVIDNCEAIDLVLHKGKEGEVYNIGGGTEIPNIELTKKILNILDKPESLIKSVKDRLGHDRRYSLDCTKIQKELGWKPKYNFDDALKATCKWYIDNESWWRKLK